MSWWPKSKRDTEFPPQPIFVERLSALNYGEDGHAAGTFTIESLLEIESLLPKKITASAETGCGKSTIFFSNISSSHHVFALNDRELGDASNQDGPCMTCSPFSRRL